MNRENIEKKMEQEQYIIALEETVKDLKMALNTITLLDDIKEAHDIAQEMLNDFYNPDEFTKKTILQKEEDLLRHDGIIDDERKLIRKKKQNE